VEHTAERYDVSKSSLQQIKTFVSGFLNGGEPERTGSTIGRKRTVRLAVRKSGAMRRSGPVRLTAGSARTTVGRSDRRRPSWSPRSHSSDVVINVRFDGGHEYLYLSLVPDEQSLVCTTRNILMLYRLYRRSGG
jgi:hypothetical protein